AWLRVLPSAGMMATVASEGGPLIWFDGDNWVAAKSGAGGAIVSETGDFDVDAGHYGNTVRVSSTDPVTVTLPKTAGAGVAFHVLQVGNGYAEFEAESGGALHHFSGHT